MDDQDKSDAYQRGFTAGYQRRMQEEVASYFQAITAGHQVYDRVLRGLVNTPTASERELRRTWVVWQGHVAGLHDGGRRGCPYCDRLMREHPWARSETCPDCAHRAYVHTLNGCQAIDTMVDGDNLCPCQVREDMFRIHLEPPLCEAHGQPMIPGLRAIVDGKIEQAWHCACSVTYRGPVPAHNGHYGVSTEWVGPCKNCGNQLRRWPDGNLTADPGLTRWCGETHDGHEVDTDNAPKSDYGVPAEIPVASCADGPDCTIAEHFVGAPEVHIPHCPARYEPSAPCVPGCAGGTDYPCEGAEYGVCGGGPVHDEACPSSAGGTDVASGLVGDPL